MGKSNSFHLSRGATIGLSVAAGVLGIFSFGFGMAALAGTMAGLAGVTTAGLTTAATAATTAAFTGAVGGAASVMVAKSQYNDAVKSGVGVKAAKRNLIMSSVGMGLSGLDVMGAGASMYQGVRAAQVAMTAGVLGVGGGIGMGVAQTTQGIQEAQRGTKGSWKDIAMGLGSIGMAGVGVYAGARGASKYMDLSDYQSQYTDPDSIVMQNYFLEKNNKQVIGSTKSPLKDHDGITQVNEQGKPIEIASYPGMNTKEAKAYSNLVKRSITVERGQLKQKYVNVPRVYDDVQYVGKGTDRKMTQPFHYDEQGRPIIDEIKGSGLQTYSDGTPVITETELKKHGMADILNKISTDMENHSINQKSFTMFSTRVSVANIGIRVLQSENIVVSIGVTAAA